MTHFLLLTNLNKKVSEGPGDCHVASLLAMTCTFLGNFGMVLAKRNMMWYNMEYIQYMVCAKKEKEIYL